MIGGFITWLVMSRMGRLVASALAAMLILGIAVLKGMSIQKAKQERQKMKDMKETMKRIENVKVNTDRRSALDRLHKTGRVRDKDSM